MKSEKITVTTLVSQSEVAAVLGLTGRRVRQMIEDGILQTQDGKLCLADAVQTYIKAQSKVTDDEKKLDATRKKAETQMKVSKAAIAMLEANELKGKMHRADDIAAITNDMIYAIRGALLALPGRLAVDVSACKTPAEASTVIRSEVFKVMTKLSGYQYDPNKYKDRVRERMDWSGDEVEDDE